MNVSSTICYFQCILAFLVILQRSAECCSCYARHPQEIFCSKNTDFVIKAVVVSGRHTYEQNLSLPERHLSGLAYYNTYITKIFKGHEALKSIFLPKNLTGNFNPRRQKAILFTSATSGTCGVFLKPGTKYLISGIVANSKIKVGTCDLVVPFGQLSRQQRDGVRGSYDCQCSLERCPIGQVCARPSNSCEWVSGITSKELQCDMKHRACKKYGDECLWHEDHKYEPCVVKHRNISKIFYRSEAN